MLHKVYYNEVECFDSIYSQTLIYHSYDFLQKNKKRDLTEHAQWNVFSSPHLLQSHLSDLKNVSRKKKGKNIISKSMAAQPQLVIMA